MKKRLTSVLFAFALVVSLGLVTAAPAMAAETYYVATDGDDSPGNGSEALPWATITYALSQATSGDTIIVAAGTYTNDIWDSVQGTPDGYRITKSVTLLGAQSGVDPDGSTDRGGESVLVRTNGLPYSLYAANITIDGFTFTSGGGSGGGRVIVNDNADGATIRNCIIRDISGTDPHGIYIYSGAENVLIERNTLANTGLEAISCGGEAEISNNTIKDIASNKGIYVQPSGDAIIADNTISNTYYEGIQAAGTATITGNDISGCYKGIQLRDSAGGSTVSSNTITAATYEGIEALVLSTIDGNEISGCYKGVMIAAGAGGSTISNNTITDATFEGIQAFAASTITGNEISGCSNGIQVRNHATGTVISSNDIHNNDYHGLEIPNYGGAETDVTTASIRNNSFTENGYTGMRVGGGTDGSGIAVHCNNFIGNGYFGVESVTASSMVDATKNWWGDSSGPYHATSNPDGLGNAVSDNVDFEPWLGAEIVIEVTETVTDGTVDATKEADTEVLVTGTATVTVALFADNPGGPAPTGFSALGKYMGVCVADTSAVTEIEIRVYYTAAEVATAGLDEASLKLFWWDGDVWEASSDSGVEPGTVNGYDGYIWAVITGDTMPSLDDLTGVPFGAFGSPLSRSDGPSGTYPVGGEAYSANKVMLLTPWAGVIALIMAGSAVALRRRTVRD